jgi:hypothetical protein
MHGMMMKFNSEYIPGTFLRKRKVVEIPVPKMLTYMKHD